MRQPAVSCVVSVGLFACGDVLPGAPPGDAATDAAIDAVPGAVTATVLTALGDGAPDSAARVLFQDPDGNVVLDTGVDAQGRAQALLPRGGTVSAIRVAVDTSTQLAASITTTRGVKPGDDLTFGLAANATTTNQGGATMMTAMFTQAMDATRYTFFTPCGASPATVSPATLNFRDSCHGATFDLLGTAFVPGSTAPLFFYERNVAYQSGGTTQISRMFEPMATFAVNLTNVPEPVTGLSVARASMIENLPAVSTSVNFPGDPGVGNVSVATPFPQGVGTRSEIAITMSRADTKVLQRHEVHTATLGTGATIDLGKQQLPWISRPAVTATGATWTLVAAGDPPDGMLLRWQGSWNDGIRPVSITWNVVQPAELAGATLPALPAAYAKFDPGQQSARVTPGRTTLYMADYDNLAGYDQLRQQPETLLTMPIGVMGAFVGMPFQRRILEETVDP